MIVSLSILCAVLLIGFLWLLFQKPKAEKVTTALLQNPPADLTKQQNPQEKKLLDTLHHITGKTLLLTDSLFRQPIVLSDTLLIQKDSLHIQGKGNIIFRKDSAFSGAAIVLSPLCKSILIDNLTLENFDIGIVVQGNAKALQLKNVRFVNCKVPVQYQFNLPNNQYINGTLGERSFFKWDTLPKTK